MMMMVWEDFPICSSVYRLSGTTHTLCHGTVQLFTPKHRSGIKCVVVENRCLTGGGWGGVGGVKQRRGQSGAEAGPHGATAEWKESGK